MARLAFEPLISPVLWVTLAAAAVALLVWYGWSRPTAVPRARWGLIVALMALSLTAVFTVLLNPLWIEPLPPPAGKPLLTMLVDVSQSMATSDNSSGKTRFQEATEIVKQQAKKLEGKFDVRLRTFSASTTPIAVEELEKVQPKGLVTDLATALSEVVESGQPQGQGVMLLSDGAHHAPGGMRRLLEVVRNTRAVSVPVYPITLGGPGNLRDLEVALLRPQELSFAEQSVPVSVQIRQRGRVTDRAKVTLSYDGKVVGRQEIPLNLEGTAAGRFQVSQKSRGLYRYEVRVDSVPGEATLANNTATFVLRVVDEPIRILLLEGKPYWDTKFLMRNFAADPVLEVDCLMRLKTDRYLKRSLRLNKPAPAVAAAKPKTPEDAPAQKIGRTETTEFLPEAQAWLSQPDNLKKYQIVVLGRDSEVFLTEEMLIRLRDWVAQEGGSLVCYRGSPVAQVTQTLDRMLPVRWTPARESHFRVQLTDFGSALRWVGDPGSTEGGEVLGKLPSLASGSQVTQPKPLAVVLARSSREKGTPVVTYQPYASGRVVTIEGAGMWRWAFLSPDYHQNDDVYGSLWQSLLRWLVSSAGLSPGQPMALRSDRILFTAGEPVSATLYLRKETPTDKLPAIELRQEGQAAVREVKPTPLGDEPGVFQVSFGALQEGRYRARIAGVAGGQTADEASTSVAFDVQGALGEQLDVAARPDIMARIATETGGEVLSGDGAGSLTEKFTEYTARNRPEQVRRTTAWDRWWWLGGIFVLWCAAWGVRRASGLI